MSFIRSKQAIAVAVLLLAFAGVKTAAVLWWQNSRGAEAAAQPVAACRVEAGGCPFLGSARFRLEGVGDGKAPFAIRAEGVPDNIGSVSASFRMDGMDMGFNRFDLVRNGRGRWQLDNARLPFCVAGRHGWIVEWSADGRRFQAAFSTQP